MTQQSDFFFVFYFSELPHFFSFAGHLVDRLHFGGKRF